MSGFVAILLQVAAQYVKGFLDLLSLFWPRVYEAHHLLPLLSAFHEFLLYLRLKVKQMIDYINTDSSYYQLHILA